MVRKIASIAASAVLFVGLSSCSLTKQELVEVTHNIEVPPKMVFLGDSIPDGYGLDGYMVHDNSSCQSYPNLLEEKYKTELADEKCDIAMYNFAVSGHTSADLIERIQVSECIDALGEADAIVVSIGGNDMLHIVFDAVSQSGIKFIDGKINTDDLDVIKVATMLKTWESQIDSALEQFEVNLLEIVDTLDEKSDGVIYIQTLYDPFEPYENVPVYGDFIKEKLDKLNEVIKSNSSGKYTVVDVVSAFSGKAEMLTNINQNDVHPNETGHKLIAEKVDASFRKTGFTYDCQEYGEPHFTALAYGLMISAVVLTILMLFYISRMFKPKK